MHFHRAFLISFEMLIFLCAFYLYNEKVVHFSGYWLLVYVWSAKFTDASHTATKHNDTNPAHRYRG